MNSVSHKYFPPSSEELERVVQDLQLLLGHRLQDVELSLQLLSLGFYGGGDLKWLVFDLHPKSLGLFLMTAEERPQQHLVKKPLSLFINSHLRDKRLVAIERDQQKGRLVRLVFTEPVMGPMIEVILIPSLVNVTTRADGKTVSLHKPRQMTAANQDVARAVRSPQELKTAWQQWVSGQTSVPANDNLEQKRLRKQSAIEKVKADLAKKSPQLYRDLGNFLVEHQTLDVPKHLRDGIDSDISLAANIQRAFTKAKDLEIKVERTHDRLRTLERELNEMTSTASPKNFTPKATKPTRPQSAYRGRTLKLEDDIVFVVGRSAMDNLAILRQSRAWDLWLHMKDRPGSHGILFRQKNQTVSDELLKKSAVFLLQVSAPTQFQKWRGERVDILVTECRFVRPIKGDRLGRVTHQKARTLRVLL